MAALLQSPLIGLLALLTVFTPTILKRLKARTTYPRPGYGEFPARDASPGAWIFALLAASVAIPILHEPARVHILTLLSVVESADFLFVMRQTGLTKGNLSSHMGKLEAAGYLQVKKEFVEKIAHTLLRITDRGREALEGYRRNMAQVLEEPAKK